LLGSVLNLKPQGATFTSRIFGLCGSM
jgi:hypothetical protein